MRLFIVFIFICNLTIAQKSIRDEWSLQFKAKSGMLIAHRGTMAHLYKESVIGGEVSLYRRMRGYSWSDAYKQPYAGVTLFGSNLGNKEILGFGFGLYSFLEFPWFKSERHVISSKLGAGLGYVNKVYDPESNPKNLAMGSHVNALICLGIQGRWYLSKNDALVYGVDMTHFSNGATSMPNLGVNLPYLSLGYARVIHETMRDSLAKKQFERSPFFKHWNFSPIGIFSFKETIAGGKKHPVVALNALFYKQFKPKVGMEVGLDFISKQALFEYRSYIPKTQWSIFQIGTYVGYAIPMDKFRIVIGMGYYVKDRYDADDELYHRVGMRYQMKNNLLLNLVLKSHWAKADYVEFGIGYTFKSKVK